LCAPSGPVGQIEASVWQKVEVAELPTSCHLLFPLSSRYTTVSSKSVIGITMIYDFGCLGHMDLLPKVFVALPGAVAAFAIIAGLAVIGALLNRSKQFQAYDIFSGWCVVASVMTVAAVSFTKALPFVTLALFVLIAIAAIPALKRRLFVSPFWLLALFPGLFILTAINIAGIAKWDDFSHWVLNALYLFHYDSVPSRLLPLPHSGWPGYPYALPFLTYMASWLVGGFLMQGGAMISFLLFIAFASVLVETLTPSTDPRPLNLRVLGTTALALLLVTLGNPGFNASFSITSEGDAPTTILIGALALLLWKITNKLNEKDRAGAASLTLPVILIGTTLVLIKQVNLVLLMLLIIGFLVVAVKNRILKPALMQAGLIIIPALIMRSVWQYYIDVNMAGKEFSMHLLSAWRFDLFGPILQAMAHAMIKANGLSLMMLAVTAYGAYGLFRPATPRRNFALMAGIVYVGYVAFLLVAYLGASFHEDEIRRAASFYRYCTHISLLGISALWMAAPVVWERLKNKSRWPSFLSSGVDHSGAARRIGIVLLITLLPIVFIVHAEWIVPQPASATCQIRSFGQKLAAALPDHSKLVVLEPESEGLFTFLINFELDLQSVESKKSLYVVWDAYRSKNELDWKKLPQYIAQIEHRPDVTTLLVPQAEHNPVTIAGYDNRRAPLVLERSSNGWTPLMP